MTIPRRELWPDMGKNIRSTTAKERMLKKIRHSLLQKRENPYPHFEDTPLFHELEGSLPVLFAEQFTEQGGQFLYCDSELQWMESLLILIEEQKLRQIVVVEPVLREILDRYEFPYLQQAEDMTAIDLGISTCEALISRDGSILWSDAGEPFNQLPALASHHLILAGVGQIVPDLKDGMAYLKQKYAKGLPPLIRSLRNGGSQKRYVFLLDY